MQILSRKDWIFRVDSILSKALSYHVSAMIAERNGLLEPAGLWYIDSDMLLEFDFCRLLRDKRIRGRISRRLLLDELIAELDANLPNLLERCAVLLRRRTLIKSTTDVPRVVLEIIEVRESFWLHVRELIDEHLRNE